MYVSLDIETTGFDPEKDEIIEIAAVKFDEKGITETFSSLIYPGKNIPKNVTILTGITDQNLSKAPKLHEIQKDLTDFIGDHPIIAHNVQFDIQFLKIKNLDLKNPTFDTCELARILIPNQPSYSLEILTKNLELSHENKHRALDDALAAIELFKLLMQKIHEIPPNILKEIRNLCEKSDWNLKKLFKEPLKNVVSSQNFQRFLNAKPTLAIVSDRKSRAKREARMNRNLSKIPQSSRLLNKALLAAIQTQISTIIEAENYHLEHHLKDLNDTLKNKKILIAAPKNSPLFIQNLPTLHHANHYLCINRLEKLKQQAHFQNTEIALIIKILLKEPLQNGTRDELQLFQEEYAFWPKISAEKDVCTNCTPTTCFYKKAQENALKSNIIIISHEFLLNNSDLNEFQTLIIEQVDQIVDQAPFFLTNFSNLSKLENALFCHFKEREQPVYQPEKMNEEFFSKSAQTHTQSSLEILFGLMGILIEKFSNPDDFMPQVIIDDAIRNSLEWRKITDALSNLEETIKDMPETDDIFKKEFQRLAHTINESENNIVWIIKTREITIKSAPKNLPETIYKTISRYQTFILLSQNLTVKTLETQTQTLFNAPTLKQDPDFSYIKKELGLPENMQAQKIPSNTDRKIPLYIPENFPETNTAGNFKTSLACIKNIIREKKGRIFILMNSERTIEEFHNELASEFCDTGTSVLSQKQSGGMGKIIDQYISSPENTVLIGNRYFFEQCIEQTRYSKTAPLTLIIYRLLFDPPGNPILQEKFKSLKNPFMEHTIPSTTLKIKNIINTFIHAMSEEKSEEKSIYFFDTRIITKEYSSIITNSLPSSIELVKKHFPIATLPLSSDSFQRW